MNKIWSDFESGTITAQEAFKQINKRLETASPSESKRLMELSEKIIDKEVPMPETDEVSDKCWQDNYKEE